MDHLHASRPTVAPAKPRSVGCGTAVQNAFPLTALVAHFPPVLVRIGCEHIRTFGVAPDGRLIRSAAGDHLDASAYGVT